MFSFLVNVMKVKEMYKLIKGVKLWRKQDFHGTAGGTFLRDHPALPHQ
jgi:hypothetical protein